MRGSTTKTRGRSQPASTGTAHAELVGRSKSPETAKRSEPLQDPRTKRSTSVRRTKTPSRPSEGASVMTKSKGGAAAIDGGEREGDIARAAPSGRLPRTATKSSARAQDRKSVV